MPNALRAAFHISSTLAEWLESCPVDWSVFPLPLLPLGPQVPEGRLQRSNLLSYNTPLV